MRILVTNDDGIASMGLAQLAAALASVGEVTVVAPATNQTGMGRAISLRGTVEVRDADVGGVAGHAISGTPVDCVRFALMGLCGEPPELVVAGVNQGANLGDDVTYSGTVAAALEGVLNGLPALAFSQQSLRGAHDWSRHARFVYDDVCSFARVLVERVSETGLRPGTLLNVNAPGVQPGSVAGVRATRLGRRIYRSTLQLERDDGDRRSYRLWDDRPGFHAEEGTDFAALEDGCISVTPMHFDLTDHDGLELLGSLGLETMAP